MKAAVTRLLFLLLSLLAFAVQAAPPADTVRVHYHRTGEDYAGWGLHIWGDDVRIKRAVNWDTPLMATGRDDFGIYFDIPVIHGGGELNFIIHLGEEKNVAKNMHVLPDIHGREVWQLQGDPVLYTARPTLSGQVAALNGPVSSILQEVPAATRAKLSPEALAIIDKLRRDAELKFQQQGQNQSKIEADLYLAQNARKAAEEQLAAAAKVVPAVTVAAPAPAGTSILWPISLALVIGFAIIGWRQLRRSQDTEIDAMRQAVTLANDRIVKEMEDRETAEHRILQLANYDELTSLPNRAILNQTITQALAKCRRFKKQIAILFIDLDRFKFINDTMGHGAGDYVLKTVADRFKQCLRETDTIARLGGDEFVVLIESLDDPKYVAGVAQKLVVSAQQAFIFEGQECHVTASIGISTYPNDGKDAATLLKNADIAMYRAKEQGKNNFQYYSEAMNMHLLQRLALESSLRHALKRNELVLFYQPIVEVESLSIVGVEALIRWRHPDMGLVGPLQFIPLAEETGLIVEIGRWVVQEACEQGKRWNEMGFALNISVNLSPRQLSDPDIVEHFNESFISSGFPAKQLILEITESVMMNNPDESVEILQALKGLGPRIAIDDFGTGYSSLAYLRRFPIDILKVDRSFLQDIPADPDSSILTAAVIALSHSMHLSVVAEGVETNEQRDFLLAHKCQRFQGYWFSKPKPADEITEMLVKRREEGVHAA